MSTTGPSNVVQLHPSAAAFAKVAIPRLHCRYHLIEMTEWGERAAWEGDDLALVAANGRNMGGCSRLYIRDTASGDILYPHEWPERTEASS